MARYAVLSEDNQFIEDIIIMNETQLDEMQAALGRTLINAAPLGLAIGDMLSGDTWTRNVEGEQVPLPVGDSPDAEEILRILFGPDEEDEE